MADEPQQIHLRIPAPFYALILEHHREKQARTPQRTITITEVALDLLAAGLSAEKEAARG